MTTKKLQARVESLEKEVSEIKFALNRSDDSDAVLITIISQYKCKTCMLYHFPAPMKGCMRVKENRIRLAAMRAKKHSQSKRE
jgi:hypothetical protein